MEGERQQALSETWSLTDSMSLSLSLSLSPPPSLLSLLNLLSCSKQSEIR